MEKNGRLTEMKFVATEEKGEVTALLLRPGRARWLMVFAHASGTGMRHASMESISAELAKVGIATFRYQFPYMEAGGGGLNVQRVLLETVRSAVDTAVQAAPDLPLLAGGRSMGGRMTSLAAAASPLPGVRGIVFFAFPLHPSGKPATERGDHLFDVPVPMLFLQGTRDKLADLDLLRPICRRLGKRATLHVLDTADHSFKVLKRSGKTDERTIRELAQTVEAWASELG